MRGRLIKYIYEKSEEISEAETRAVGGLCRRRSRAEHRPYPWSPARSSFGGGPTARDWGYLHVWPDRRTRRHRWAAPTDGEFQERQQVWEREPPRQGAIGMLNQLRPVHGK